MVAEVWWRGDENINCSNRAQWWRGENVVKENGLNLQLERYVFIFVNYTVSEGTNLIIYFTLFHRTLYT